MNQQFETQLEETLSNIEQKLFEACDPRGFWTGRLSSSALATATAVFALYSDDARKHSSFIESGLQWLICNVNEDGGWGDTIKSESNISTTMLCWAALSAADERNEHEELIDRTRRWLLRHTGSLTSEALAAAVDARYRNDKTFSVPILTMCALAGLPRKDSTGLWAYIKPLPFELSLMPRILFRWLPLSVVSYALPALISMGLANLKNNAAMNPLAKLVRSVAKKNAMRVLTRIQPSNGGFLEAVPLTAFVVMSLIGAGQHQNAVVRKGVGFILQSMRDDGSWPVDTNLSTWLTSLSVNSFSSCSGLSDMREGTAREKTLEWLLEQQYTTRHPYTDAEPGGWAWTDLPGGVPDADDTAGALIAIHHLGRENKTEECKRAAERGLKWLVRLRNNDGGIPTFCKGWTNLPFDRSAPDLTAHAISAFCLWSGEVNRRLQKEIDRAKEKAFKYLQESQGVDGAWVPLWFGNEKHVRKYNPLYGTARVILGIHRIPAAYPLVNKGANWILDNQNEDGGWGGASGLESSVEETALAVDALASVVSGSVDAGSEQSRMVDAATRGARWLIHRTKKGRALEPAPIGLYFAQLWYFEKLYPCIYTVSALGKFRYYLMDYK